MKAVGNFVVVEHSLNSEKVSASGLIESVEGATASKRGVVVSVGEHVPDNLIQVGSVVWFVSYDLKFDEDDKDGKKLLGIKFPNIVAVE